MHIFKKTFMEATQTHNLRMTPKVHALVSHVHKFVRGNGVALGPTSDQTLESQHKLFDIFYQRLEVNYTKSPAFRERLLNVALHHNSCHLQTAG